MTLSEAAEALGYSQPVQLSLMENGCRLPPTLLIQEAARLFGTTADFLCGLATDSDRDPLVALHREAAAQVAGEVRRALNAATAAAAAAVRADTAARAARRGTPALARGVVVAALSFDRLRQANPNFDDLKGGATLARQLDELARDAEAALADCASERTRVAASEFEAQHEACELDVQRALQRHCLSLAGHTDESEDT